MPHYEIWKRIYELKIAKTSNINDSEVSYIFLISNHAVLGTFKSYPLKVASTSKELSNAIPGRDVALYGGLSAVFDALLKVVGNAAVVDAAHIFLCKHRASPALRIVAQPHAGHKAVHALEKEQGRYPKVC